MKILNCHIKYAHSTEENVTCDICGQKCQSKTKLYYHIRRNHCTRKPIACSVIGCDKKLSDRGGLAQHSRIHSGEKPFKCDMCQTTFRKPDHLRKHKKLHTGERPYVCQHCSKSFIQKINMKIHMKKCSVT